MVPAAARHPFTKSVRLTGQAVPGLTVSCGRRVRNPLGSFHCPGGPNERQPPPIHITSDCCSWALVVIRLNFTHEFIKTGIIEKNVHEKFGRCGSNFLFSLALAVDGKSKAYYQALNHYKIGCSSITGYLYKHNSKIAAGQVRQQSLTMNLMFLPSMYYRL